jgi:dolichol kinase
MITPLLQNTSLSLIVFGITFAVLFLLSYLNNKNAITNEVSRKVVHIGAGTLYLAIYFYNDQGYFSKYLNIFPNVYWTCVLLWKSQHNSSGRQKHDLVVGTMTRTYRGSELLRGPLFFNFVMIACGTILYKTVLGSTIMGILTWGDGLAAVIGVRYGNQRKIYRSKSFDGWLAMFIASLIASVIYIALLVGFQSVDLFKICIISLVAAVIETLSPSDFDNLAIPLSILVMHFFIY